MDIQKMEIVKASDKRIGRINWWGMFFAFMAILVFIGLTVYAFYLDKPWFAGLSALGSLTAIVSIFVKKDSK